MSLRSLTAEPSEAERHWAFWRQAFRLPCTLRAIFRMVREEFHPAALDEHLWAFEGFSLRRDDPLCRARPWRKVRLNGIGPGSVIAMAAEEMTDMLDVSMEIEEPIQEYSLQNGEGFRLLLPRLGQFLGKSQEEAEEAARQGRPWCESPWCAEERRHANSFARMIERLTGAPPERRNPNRPRTATADEADARRLLISRQSAEWNSSSTYIVMAAHASGDLGRLIRNIASDEVKHLAILGAADLYLLGPRPWRRFGGLIRNGLDEYRGHQKRRSRGARMGSNPVTAFEVIVCHLLEEFRVRKWLAGLPLCTLEAIFEEPAGVREEPGGPVREEEEKRRSLARWAQESRRRALGQRGFEQSRRQELDDAAARLGRFAGAEADGSPGDRNLRKGIRGLARGRLRTALLDRLRDYQIRRQYFSP
jgi:hypothetical protein